MKSEIQLGTDSLSALTNPDRPMVGQAPYVLNTGLLYASPGGRWTANLLLNVVGRRIVEAGQQPLPDAYEEPQPVLDFAFRAPLGETAQFKLKINNILDSKFQITQGDVTRLSYLSGRQVSFGFGWSL